MPGLLRAQQIARAADFQIPHGNFKAGTKFRKIPYGAEALFRDFRQSLVWLIGKVGIGMAVGTTDPPAKLVQLRQPQPVGVFNN